MAKKKATPRKKVQVYEFTISLLNTKPLVWRKVLAHDFIELEELHFLFQLAMGWDDQHLYSFDINGKTYSDEETALDANYHAVDGIILRDVLGDSKCFKYDYDFGDGWEHEVRITDVLEHDFRMNYPICIAGENACPPENCGGYQGFEHLKQTISGKDSREKDEMLAWLGGFYSPYTFDPNFVNKLFWTGDELDPDLPD